MIAAHLGRSLAADTVAAGVNYDWWQEFIGAGGGPRRDVRALDHRLRRGARQPERAARQRAARDHGRRRDCRVDGRLVVPERRRARSLRAGSADARGTASSPPAAPTSGASCASASSPWLRLRVPVRRGARTGSSTGVYPAPDARPDVGADGLRRAPGWLPGLRRCCCRCNWSSTTRGSGSSSRIAAARSARSSPAPGSCGGTSVRSSVCMLLNGAAFVLLVLLVYAARSPGAPGDGLCDVGDARRSASCYIVARHYLKLLFYASAETPFSKSRWRTPHTPPPRRWCGQILRPRKRS